MNDYPLDKRSDFVCRVPLINYQEVNLDLHAQRDVAIDYFCKRFNLNPEYSIKDDNVVHIYEAVTTHSFDITDVIREATEQDALLYGMLRKLKEKL